MIPTLYPRELLHIAEEVAVRNPRSRFTVAHNPLCRPPVFDRDLPNVRFATSEHVPVGQLVLIDTNEVTA